MIPEMNELIDSRHTLDYADFSRPDPGQIGPWIARTSRLIDEVVEIIAKEDRAAIDT